MRWNEIRLLIESVGKYRPMFNMFGDKLPSWMVDDSIKKVERLFKREDRIVWALRWLRIHLYYEMNVNASDKDKTIYKKITSNLCHTPLDEDSVRFHSLNFVGHQTGNFEHFFSMPIASIQNYVFDKQTPNEIITQFEEFEKKWSESRRQVIDHLVYKIKDDDDDDDDDDDPHDELYGRKRQTVRGEPTIFMDFGNGWTWWDLDREYCAFEGGAMGHCGNSATPNRGDTVLSLRKHINGTEYRPSLTFILGKDGYLTEMKGRANDKPKPEYHDMIIALLKDERINGIDGGGYAAENNFSIFDLPEATREQLLAVKPTLMSLRDKFNQYEAQKSPDALKALNERIKSFLKKFNPGWTAPHLNYQRIEMIHDVPTIIIHEWEDSIAFNRSTQLATSLSKTVTEFFNHENLVDEFMTSGINRKDAEILAYRTYDEYSARIYSGLLPYGVGDFDLDGTDIKMLPDGKIITFIPVRMIITPSSTRDNLWVEDEDDDDHDTVLERIYDLDDTVDGTAWQSAVYSGLYRWENISDSNLFAGWSDATMEIAEYVWAGKTNPAFQSRMIQTIMSEIGGDLEDIPYHSNERSKPTQL